MTSIYILSHKNNIPPGWRPSEREKHGVLVLMFDLLITLLSRMPHKHNFPCSITQLQMSRVETNASHILPHEKLISSFGTRLMGTEPV